MILYHEANSIHNQVQGKDAYSQCESEQRKKRVATKSIAKSTPSGK